MAYCVAEYLLLRSDGVEWRPVSCGSGSLSQLVPQRFWCALLTNLARVFKLRASCGSALYQFPQMREDKAKVSAPRASGL